VRPRALAAAAVAFQLHLRGDAGERLALVGRMGSGLDPAALPQVCHTRRDAALREAGAFHGLTDRALPVHLQVAQDKELARFVLMVLTMIVIRTAAVLVRGRAAGADLAFGESKLLRRLNRTA
jgi:hypothetical protein